MLTDLLYSIMTWCTMLIAMTFSLIGCQKKKPKVDSIFSADEKSAPIPKMPVREEVVSIKPLPPSTPTQKDPKGAKDIENELPDLSTVVEEGKDEDRQVPPSSELGASKSRMVRPKPAKSPELRLRKTQKVEEDLASQHTKNEDLAKQNAANVKKLLLRGKQAPSPGKNEKTLYSQLRRKISSRSWDSSYNRSKARSLEKFSRNDKNEIKKLRKIASGGGLTSKEKRKMNMVEKKVDRVSITKTMPSKPLKK